MMVDTLTAGQVPSGCEIRPDEPPICGEPVLAVLDGFAMDDDGTGRPIPIRLYICGRHGEELEGESTCLVTYLTYMDEPDIIAERRY